MIRFKWRFSIEYNIVSAIVRRELGVHFNNNNRVGPFERNNDSNYCVPTAADEFVKHASVYADVAQ